MSQKQVLNRSRTEQFSSMAIAIIAIILTFQAVSVMMFASLGSTSIKEVNYILILQIVLGTIGISTYVGSLAKLNLTALKKFCSFLSLTLGSMLLGFYYGGVYTDNNPQFAIAGAIALAVIFHILNYKKYQLISTATILISGICAYGFALMTGIRAINLFSVSLFISGIIWGSICLIYLGLTVHHLGLGIKEIQVDVGSLG